MQPTIHRLARTLILLPALLAACDADFEENLTPLVIDTPPPPLVFVTPGAGETPTPLVIDTPPPPIVFVTPGAGETPAPLETEPAEQITMVPVESTPQVQPLCTTDYLRLRSQPAASADELVVMPPGSEVEWTGEQTTADGYTWYEVAYSADTQGWAASLWLSEGECEGAVVGGGNFGLIQSGYVSGYDWLDADSGTEHFGIDLHSSTGETGISSPYAGQVVDSDTCAACVEADSEEGNTLGEFDLDYNYGYGAMMVVEYSYADLTDEQRSDLEADGFELSEGQSIYLMLAHLDPNQTIAGDATVLAQGDGLADIGNSGNSDGAHTHLEMAINDSGLTPSEDQATVNFWLDTVAERVYGAEEEDQRQGNRVDPTPLFED